MSYTVDQPGIRMNGNLPLFLGMANLILTFYENCMVLQSNHLPLVITITASADANAGTLIELLPQIKATRKDRATKMAEEH